MFFSGLGLATTLPKFLPELQVKGGGQGVKSFVGRIGAVRFAALLAFLMPLAVYAEPVAERLALGANGATYLRALTLLLLGRTALDLSYRGLEACFLQVRVNILTLLHSALDVCLVGTALAIGWSMGGVIWALGASAAGVALVGASTLRTRVREIDRKPASAPRSRILPTRIWRFAGLTYGRDLGLYFATPAFAGPVLAAALGSPEPVALFATGFFVTSSTVTLLVSGFRGVFRPLFARIRAGGDEAQLRRAFDPVTKSQILAVVPAGAGLWVMVGDYLPLFYGHPFIAATPVARLFIVLLFAETAFSLGLLKRFSNRPCTTWGGRGTFAHTDAGGPMRAYSMVLRERALLDSDAGMKAADVAAKYRVSGSWVRLLKQRRRETGEVAPRVQRHGRRGMLEPHRHTLAALIAAHPDRTLAELKDALATPASVPTVWRAVRALGLTVKKNGPPVRTRSA